MNITNYEQLRNIMYQKVINGLLEYLSEKVVEKMQDELDNAEISTSTLQKCVKYELGGNAITGKISEIQIDYDLAQTYAKPPDTENGYVVWGKFTNTFNGYGGSAKSQKWNNEFISFQLAKWLEKSEPISISKSAKGNQPIKPIHWFSRTVEQVQTNLNKWCLEYFNKIGLNIS